MNPVASVVMNDGHAQRDGEETVAEADGHEAHEQESMTARRGGTP